MAILNLQLSPFPSFEPGERILAVRRYVRAVRAKSWPSYRWGFPLPPLFDVALYVTNRRVLTVGLAFRLLFQQFSQWYPNSSPPDGEIIKTILVGKSRVWGPYLEIVSENTGPFWLRSPELSVRYFMASPESIRDAVPLPVTGETLIPATGR